MTRAPLGSMVCRKNSGVCGSEAASSMVFTMPDIAGESITQPTPSHYGQALEARAPLIVPHRAQDMQ